MKISVQKPAPSHNVPGDHAPALKIDGGFRVTIPDCNGAHNWIEPGDTIIAADGDETLSGVVFATTRTTVDGDRVVTVDAKLTI